MLGELLRPQQFARIQIEGQNRVAGRGVGLREVIARSRINDPAPGVYGGRRPDAGARGPPMLYASLGLGRGMGVVSNSEGLPELLSRYCVQCYQRSARSTALVLAGQEELLASGQGHNHAA